MPNPTTKITTPIGAEEVEIKQWITGREAEHIDELMYEAVAVKADLAGQTDIGNVDLKKIITETNHRKIETFVTSHSLDQILDMHEDDTNFILEAIDEQRKKK